jgi:hypothetical protein
VDVLKAVSGAGVDPVNDVVEVDTTKSNSSVWSLESCNDTMGQAK